MNIEICDLEMNIALDQSALAILTGGGKYGGWKHKYTKRFKRLSAIKWYRKGHKKVGKQYKYVTIKKLFYRKVYGGGFGGGKGKGYG